MPKYLFVQPQLGPPGGASGVAAWMLDVLAARAPVTLLTNVPFDALATDLYYGTSLAAKPVTNIVYDTQLLKTLRKIPLPLRLLHVHLLARGFRHIAQSYDIICSAFEEQDFGRPCIEYIHFPWNHFPTPETPVHLVDSRPLELLMAAYRRVCCLVSGFDANRRPPNLTLVNSAWTGRLVQSVYPQANPRVLHPPAIGTFIGNDQVRREPGFLSVGRITPYKEWLKLIDIVEGLRNLGHDVGLTLAGSREDHAYEDCVRQRISEAGRWARLETDLSREALEELMATHQYALHGMKNEHYGMAVAELILGGCLTMVANDGGQVEIVTDPRLRYQSIEEAIDKWDKILRSPSLKAELLQAQQAHRSHLTTSRFVAEFSVLLEDWLSAQLSSSVA